MGRSDALLATLLTVAYAVTAFFQLGALSSPQTVEDFSDGVPALMELSEPVYVTKLRYFSGLGTGSESGSDNCGYNVEVSEDGEHWSTLWRRKDENGNVEVWYWAEAEGYEPDYAMKQGYNQLYKWEEIVPENPQYVRFLRITGKADGNQSVLELAELALYSTDHPLADENGLVPISPDGDGVRVTGCDVLFDESDTIPEKATWFNSTYFDEIYHARTAKEHIDGVYPYEITHPPLGKLILGLGIRLFGMTPFGWRFSGTLFGVLMLPILYIFLKNMFGKTVVAACGTALFATEFMHLTQTRISTIDTYAVFFILTMYFFLYRYLTLPAGTPFRKGMLLLFLSGLMWGLGAASKWTVIYAGVGLAVVYFMGFWQKLRDWPDEQAGEKARWVSATLLFSVLCFLILPFVIYVLAYLPYAWADEVDLSWSNTLRGLRESFPIFFQNVIGKLTWSREGAFEGAYIPRDSLTGAVANNQWYMFNYHSGVNQSHPYSAWWFQWVANLRPILYYMDNEVPGYTTRFAAFSNPIVCWGGFLAILTCFSKSFRRTWSKLAFLGGLGVFAAIVTWRVQHTPNGVFDPVLEETEPEALKRNMIILIVCLLLYLAIASVIALCHRGKADGRNAFLTVAFLSQLVPWFFIGRTTFEYHYFPSILFLVFALAELFNSIWENDSHRKIAVFGLTGVAAGLYFLFYPVLIGLQIPTWYEPVVKWIESWPF